MTAVTTPEPDCADTVEDTAPARTPAENQADLMFKFAQHLRAHPHLQPAHAWVILDPSSPVEADLQVVDLDATAADLAAWADSLADATVYARAPSLDATVSVEGDMLGHRVRVWMEIPHLAERLGLPDPADPYRRVPVIVAELRGFDATVPLSEDRSGVLGVVGDPAAALGE